MKKLRINCFLCKIEDNKCILNDIDKTNKGLHIYRRLQAEIKHLQRIKTHRESSYENNDIEFQEQYFKEGIVIVEKFVGSPDDLIRIKKEFENYKNETDTKVT